MQAKEFASADIDGRVKSGKVAWRHIESEYLDVVDEIIDTLVPEGPYAYTLPWAYPEDETIPHQHFAVDMPTLRAAYEDMHRYSVVRDMQPTIEIRSDWYVFCFGLGEGLSKLTGETTFGPTAVLFPTMGEDGITGELIWRRSSSAGYYTGGRTGPLAAETACLSLHEMYVAHLRKGDVAAAAALHHPNAQIGVRDYVTESGTLAGMHSSAEYLDFLTRLFERYEVVDLQVVERAVNEWMVFAELLWVVRERGSNGGLLKFSTVDISEIREDGLFASRIGHGSDITAA